MPEITQLILYCLCFPFYVLFSNCVFFINNLAHDLFKRSRHLVLILRWLLHNYHMQERRSIVSSEGVGDKKQALIGAEPFVSIATTPLHCKKTLLIPKYTNSLLVIQNFTTARKTYIFRLPFSSLSNAFILCQVSDEKKRLSMSKEYFRLRIR